MERINDTNRITKDQAKQLERKIYNNLKKQVEQ